MKTIMDVETKVIDWHLGVWIPNKDRWRAEDLLREEFYKQYGFGPPPWFEVKEELLEPGFRIYSGHWQKRKNRFLQWLLGDVYVTYPVLRQAKWGYSSKGTVTVPVLKDEIKADYL